MIKKPMNQNLNNVTVFPGTKKYENALSKHDFDVVYADPPWDINQKGRYGASNHYELMPLRRIKELPVLHSGIGW